jgi:hypothetical protein
MHHARDDVYCHLIARRAVARAALYLGVESVSQDVLDTLGGVVVGYLERLSQVLSHSVEVSGRSSAHVNVLDAIRAVEVCTTAAVQRVHLHATATSSNHGGVVSSNGLLPSSESVSGDAAVSNYSQQNPAQDVSWKGLAAFCFGPNWHLVQQDGDTIEGTTSTTRTAAAATTINRTGGKVGPSSLATSSKDGPSFVGWKAPYPEEVPLFPLILGKAPVANPHAGLEERVRQSLHEPRTEAETKDTNELENLLETLPDSVFTNEWGTLDTPAQTTAASSSSDTIKERPTKRVRLNDPETTESSLLVPFFFPAFPKSTVDMGRTIVESLNHDNDARERSRVVFSSTTTSTTTMTPRQTAATSKDPTLSIRSALLAMDKNDYWGSSWQRQQQRDDVDSIHVPVGRIDASNSAATTTTSSSSQIIVPLGRASGSRVSKILEGSMEPSAI